MRVAETRTWVRLFVAVYPILAGVASLSGQDYVKDSRPKLFSYDELVQLGSGQDLSPELATKLRVVTTTPFINNEACLRGAKPRPLTVGGLGPTLRVAFWNIERGWNSTISNCF
jgi:hypothetical protein